MEILHKFKQNGYFTAELYHLLAKKKLLDVSEQITPSDYAKEMSMSTQERLRNLNTIEVENIVRSGNKSSKVVLSFTPKLLVFQNFKPNEKIIAKFSVKNISKAPTFLNMVYKESSFFFIKPCGGTLLSRLAPGISVSFAITFIPVQFEDYTHRVTFYTDVDQYVLPLIAMGPRPVFDFPDAISIPKTPLKVENQIYIGIHNVGLVPAGFVMNTKCPFSVYPKSAFLSPNQKIDIRVAFKTMHLGEMNGTLFIIFETGENFRIDLTGGTYTVSIDLEKEVVRFPDTYKTMVRQQIIKITNKSDHLLTYMCMKNDCVYYDFQDKVKFATMFYNVKGSESSKDMKLVQYDVLSSDEHDRVYTRIFYDEIQSLVADESLLFQDAHFSILPIQGKLWPNKSTELTITFNPKEIGDFVATAYLDLDGVSERVPLRMVGASLPPAIQLNLETLDMDSVYINKTYNYEIVAINKGHINGVIVYKEESTLFGSVITCSPKLHCLRPGDKEIFIISFSNSNQGPYFEEINFSIRDTNVLLKLYLKGEVIYPSLSFSVPCLNFGTVSIGLPKTLHFEVINESIVQVNASVKISSDGPEVSSITLEDYAVALSPKPLVPQWPREFNIVPSRIIIEPESRVSLRVTLTANLIRANQTALELELEKSDSPPIVLPVLFNAMVPKVTPAADIRLRACFIDFPYKQEIQVVCRDFWGYFTLEENQANSTLRVTVDIKEGIIEPNSTIYFPVTIQTSVLGVQEYVIRMRLFGMSNPIDICNITGCGVRPIVTCAPMALHWGQVKLLAKSQKTLTLCNDSPVNVNFRASILNRDGRWQIYPTEGYIAPEEETDLYLTVYLIDADIYSNKAVIQLEKVKDIIVPLTVTGVGTSIVVGEQRDKIMLGRHFTKIPLNCTVIMENCGTRLHSLEWNEFYKAPKSKQNTTAFFSLEPRSFKIASGEKVELTITGVSYKVTTVREVWYLVGSVEGINKKELLLECLIVAEFVDPKIELSSTFVDFQYDYSPYSEYYKLTDIITIKNVSKLPLDLDLCVRPPFAIIQRMNTYKILPEEEQLCCCICYNKSDLNIAKIISEAGPKQSRAFIDYLTLKPVEPLRKGPLQFFQDINKIKMAFHLTHAVEERLEDQDVMKLQILFDTTKHVSLKSRVYCDLMRIKFKGHKNKDAVKVIGRINFPNLFIMSPKLDFQCILNGSVESRTIKIQNVTPLMVCYQLLWKRCIITSMKVPEIPKIEYASDTTDRRSFTEESEPTTVSVREIMTNRLPLESMNKINDETVKNPFCPQDGHESFCVSIIEESELDPEVFAMRVKKKIVPMLNGNYEPEFTWSHKFSKVDKPIKVNINDVIQLVPNRGMLKPSEVQYIHVIFKPTPNVNVRAWLECEVLGGPSESIMVTGQSSDLIYKIDTRKINFKIRSFHEYAYEQLVISNIAQLPFEYKTYLNEPKFEDELEGTILDLEPAERTLEPEEEADMKIVMRPGIMGYFKRVFLLEIGHLPHIPVEVFGWGVIPQVYLTLPRPGIANLHHELGYRAIPSLTLEYMAAISEFFVKKGTSEHMNSPLIEKCFEDPEFKFDWHICSPWDDYPSIMDIELAIERTLVVNHIKIRPELLKIYSNTAKTGPIPGFHAIPYVIDYGVVITGSTVQCTTEITNYGPIPVKLHFAKGSNIPTWLAIKICGKLSPGESGKFDVVFSPTSINFTELEQYLELTLHLEVPYGVTIPIQIKALCAVPYLVSNVTSVDFGSVRCGDKIVYSIPLKNVGKPTCIWYATLKLKGSGPNPITVMDSSGKYEPGEGGWLSLAFKPTMEMTYEAVLIFRFHMNPTKMTIPVSGKGILPHVHIIGPNVNFPPTLPWADTTSIYFGLTNPCPFPIELIIAHSDVKWKEEEEIYQLLFKYYNKPDEMLVPAIRPGTGLPQEIIHFYNKLNENVKKSAEEEAAAIKASMKAAAAHSKKSKSFKSKSQSSTRSDGSPRNFRTEAEIIADEIKKLKENNEDPLKECLHVFDSASTHSDSSKHTRGIIIFFHGSPCEEMQCQEMAYALGKKLRIPTINLDDSIVEALCVCETPAKFSLINAINDTYEMFRQDNKGDIEELIEDAEETFGITEDDFQIISKKLDYIVNTRNVGTTPRSKASDKKKKRSPNSSVASHTAINALTLTGSTTIFQMELLQELLTVYFGQAKFHKGFVVDCLTSYIIKVPQLVLTTILKCKQIWNIHLVLCQSDFGKWAQAYEDAQKENDLTEQNAPKVYDDNEIEEIIQSFEEMTHEEYQNAPEVLKSIYIAYGLEARRQKHLEKNRISSELLLNRKEKTGKDASKSLLNVQSESKKRLKKDDNKGKPTTEFLATSAKYNDYTKNVYETLINIANNWIVEEGEIGAPIYGFNGQVVGAPQKKAKKRSELQLQSSEVTLTERGFPLTLIMCPCSHYKEALVKMFVESPIVQDALKDEEELDILKCPVNTKDFTVLLPKTFPVIHHEEPLKWCNLDELPIKKCECNQLTDLNLLDDSTQDNILNILSKWHCVCGKKVTSSQTSTSEIPSTSIEKLSDERSDAEISLPLPLHSVRSKAAPASRLVLEPGDLVRCKYTFSPCDEGNFSVKRFVEVSGWPESRVDVNATGICDLPRLDSRPKKMFQNFARRTLEEKVYKITYLDDQKLFEFGPIFVGRYRVYEEEYTMDLKNSSLMTADVEIDFLEESQVFEIDKTSITLEPGGRDKLTVSAAPAEVGVHSIVLLFCIKDNPEIVTVCISCTGVVPKVEILPFTKIIDYGKLLLYRREDDRFIVKNDSILTIMWKIQNAQDFLEDFIIGQTSGLVPRNDNQVVPVTYIACSVGVIANKVLTIEIYDEYGRGEPMMIDTLLLSAECYDVMVECAYENPNESFLNYGNVKVNSTVYQEMYLLNRGKYSIYYKLKKVKNFPEPALLKSFEANSECGVIPPTLKMVAIEFECTPVTSMNLVNVPAYTCSLLDGSKDQVVVAKFPVCVTIASFYNTFTLFPLGELNFHIIAVGSGVFREVILNNTSKCPVTYEIILPKKYQKDPDAPPVPTKGKEHKIKNPPLRCGNFLIVNDDNLLAPGTSRTLQIQFMATAAKTFEETIHFIISDTCPAEAQGVPLKLVGTGAMPTLDFWNLETTFREHLIVKGLSEYQVPESAPHCVFCENSVTLHFFCVTVNTSYTGSIDLYNNGLVACVLAMTLQYQPNTNHRIFSLDKYETNIEPLLHKNLGIIFTPKALKEYRAVLEIKLKLLDNKEQSFKICLIGEGVIPRIELISPILKQQKMANLKYPITCLGSVSYKQIKFKNISSVKSVVVTNIKQGHYDDKPIFWVTAAPDTKQMIIDGKGDDLNVVTMKIILKPAEVATLNIYYSPIKKGKTTCDVSLTIEENPYEYFMVACEAEAFMEDVILTGLEMLSMDVDLEAYKAATEGTASTISTMDSRKKRPQSERKRSQVSETKKKKISSTGSVKQSDSTSSEASLLKYILDFGGCELSSLHRRSVIMKNHSKKVYRFNWAETEYLLIKPSIGYISPGEEKDLVMMFSSVQPISIKKEIIICSLMALGDDSLTTDMKVSTWDNRHIMTVFDFNKDDNFNERTETEIEEHAALPVDAGLGSLTIVIIYSAMTEYTKYTCSLNDEIVLRDTYIYQTREFEFKITNVGNVPMKIAWKFQIDEDYPMRIDKFTPKEVQSNNDGSIVRHHSKVDGSGDMIEIEEAVEPVPSRITLFSNKVERDSVDTWFEVELPFQIDPATVCLAPTASQTFRVTFSPLEAFDFNVRLKSDIDNLDPYDQNTSCKIIAKSLIPYCHLDIDESDYLTSGRRKVTGVTLPAHMNVLEFDVLGAGCYKKSFNVINPTDEAYEFIFEMMISEKPELVPVHCDMLKGYVEGGTSAEVTFTFAPTAPGVYESHWKFIIPVHNIVMHVLVVGLVREPDVVFVPTILIIRNSLVGFTITDVVMLKNNESESLKFEFKGNSLCNESGKTPVIMDPEFGTLKPHSETPIKLIYTPIQDGPLSFKIFCSITYMTKYLTLCVNALSHSIRPKVTYYLIGNEHILNSEATTNIHLDQTASTYERTVPFTIRNDGSATFFFDWHYSTVNVKKYLDVSVEPRSGHIAPADETKCTLHFTLRQVPVQAFPVKLSITDGPEYSVLIHAEIEKPLYHFSCKSYDFGKCIVNAPDLTYKKNIAFVNDDKVPLIIDLNFTNLPELFVDYKQAYSIKPGKQLKFSIFFRPKHVREYEFTLQLWVNSLCEEIITIKGEGVPLLFDLYEGCQKSFNLGPVKVGEKIVRTIEVMNHSKVAIDATLIFKDMYPLVDDSTPSEATSICLSPSTSKIATDAGPSRVRMLQSYKDNKIREQISMDVQNALLSLKVVPSKCRIKPHQKVQLKIQFKPVGLISTLDVQLNMKVFQFERPLVRLSGSATGMSFCFSQNSLQFGRVRKRGCKVLKVMLHNKGDFGSRFWWQPLITDEFIISPQQGHVAARTNVTFTITFRPHNHNPFIKVWASCNIDNYMPLELAMYATCVDQGAVQNQTLYLECPVREVRTEYVTVTNPSDEMWLVLSEISGGPFETLREFNVEANSTFNIPIHFKPKSIGKHESQVLFSPLGESALFITLIGAAVHPNPNGTIYFTVDAKKIHSEDLFVNNITESPESYLVSTEVVKITPEKFEGYYELKYPETIKVWGEAAATCRWTFVCYEECEMYMKVLFINEWSREYQFYNIVATVKPSKIVSTMTFISRAREIAQMEIVITNPLAKDTDFDIHCDQIQCPEKLPIYRNSEATLVLTYTPLVVGETEDFLQVSNPLAGCYLYRMILKCLPAKEKYLEFTTPLGTSIPIRLRVQNRTDVRADFLSTVSHPCILAEKEYTLTPFEKGKFLVRFEPTQFGTQNCRVVFTSLVAGEFVFNIKGVAKEPKPMGPYEIKAGGSTTIKFKNIFEETRMFKICVDRDVFFLKSLYEPLRGKKEMKVPVFLAERSPQDWGSASTGCLTIESYDPADPKAKWTYFLQGI